MIQQEVIEYTFKSVGNKSLADYLKELAKKHKKIITVTPTMYTDFSKPTDRGTTGGSYCSKAVIVVEVDTVDNIVAQVLEDKTLPPKAKQSILKGIWPW